MCNILESNKEKFTIEMGELNTNLIVIIINTKQKNLQRNFCISIIFLRFILTNLRWNSLVLETDFLL